MIAAMGMARRKQISESELQGFKDFKKIMRLLTGLHEHGTLRDRAGNRILHYDQHVALQRMFQSNFNVTLLFLE